MEQYLNHKFRHGQHVHYKDKSGKIENGIVKSNISSENGFIYVVYYSQCGGNWANYRSYTSSLTRIEDLHPGWKVTLDFSKVKIVESDEPIKH